LIDKRLEQVSHRRASVGEVMALVERYRRRHAGWNVKPFQLGTNATGASTATPGSRTGCKRPVWYRRHRSQVSKYLAQLPSQARGRCGTEGTGARVSSPRGYRALCEAFTSQLNIWHKGHRMPYRLLVEGPAPIPLQDEKSLFHSVEQARGKQLGIAQTESLWIGPHSGNPRFRKGQGTFLRNYSATPIGALGGGPGRSGRAS